MNVLILDRQGRCSARPDTTIDKENGDFYAADDIVSIEWAPVLYARISKAGKAVQPGFADRYYDSIALGALLYPRCEAVSPDILDHTTLLPYPLYNRMVLEDDENRFEVRREGVKIFSCDTAGLKKAIENAIVRLSAHSSIRIGDFVAIQLDQEQPLASAEDGDCHLEATFCENKTIDIRINY